MLNRVVLVGRLVKDPDLRYTGEGVAVANFRIAVNRPFSNANGEKETDFIGCVVWRKQAENLATYMKKGNLIGLDARIQTRTYEGSDGKTVFVTEVVADSIQFLEPKTAKNNGSSNQSRNQNNNQNNNNPGNNQYAYAGGGNNFAGQGEPIDIMDEDFPF